jgi:hypothetical protein
MTSSTKSGLAAFLVVLVLIQAFLQVRIDPQRHQFEPGDPSKTGAAVKQLPIEFALGAVVGFREAIAGLLWVRADEFFHNGDYEAITPMVRIITWLDPHQIDVYQTGAWHMDYNFTDDGQRSDRRYIPLSIALLKEGIENNPTVPALDSDLAFTHYYRKVEDYVGARDWFLDGQRKIDKLFADADKPDALPATKQAAQDAGANITTLSHGLAHAYEGMGDIPDAIKQWQYCIAMHQRNIKNGAATEWGERTSLDTAQKQLYEMQQRVKWRKDLGKDPVDLGFDAELVRIAPKVFVVKGTLNVIGSKDFKLETGAHTWTPVDGARVEVRLQDADYKMKEIPNFSLSSLNLDPNVTIMQESVSVRGGKWEKKIEMNKDPEMYTFTAPKYTVTFWFNPSNTNDCPPNVQDRFGWLGEGITDKRYLDTSGQLPGDILNPIPGLRYVRKTITLTREDLLGTGEKTFTTSTTN